MPNSSKVILKINRKRSLLTLNRQMSLSDSLQWRNILGVRSLDLYPIVTAQLVPPKKGWALWLPPWLPKLTGEILSEGPDGAEPSCSVPAECSLTAHLCSRVPEHLLVFTRQ